MGLISSEQIKKELDNYLEFDSSLLFKDTDYLVIFGGSLRDIISKNVINDIDIVCLPNSMQTAINVITENGYFFIDLYSKDILNMYDDIHVIFEPKTFINSKDILNMYDDIHVIFEPKTFINSNGKKIQFIRPSLKFLTPQIVSKSISNFDSMSYSFISLLKNVDLSCCGIFWDGENIYESFIGSVIHCVEKKFMVLPNNTMYNKKRIEDRKRKMTQEKSFDEIMSQNSSNIRRERLLKLNEIFTEEKNIEDYKLKIGYNQKNEFYILNNYYPTETETNLDDLPF
jgi:hypothetical protein